MKLHEIEKTSQEKVLGGAKIVPAGSAGSWSWGAGSYTNDCTVDSLENMTCRKDYTGTISYDGHVLQGITVQDADGNVIDSLDKYAFEVEG